MTLQSLGVDALHQVLTDAIVARLDAILARSRPGQCMRVSALSEAIMVRVCEQFATRQDADVVLLIGAQRQPEHSWQVSATRLIELRNAEKRPLMVCVPPGLKVPAEDSFDISTFAEIDLGDIPHQIGAAYHQQLPEDLRPLVGRVLTILRREHRVSADETLRFYATILANGPTTSAVGGALYHLRLIPDFALLTSPAQIEDRLDRNMTAVRTLTEGVQPLLGRIHDLKLEKDTLQGALFAFLRMRPVQDIPDWASAIATDEENRGLAFEHWRFAGEVRNVTRVKLYIDNPALPPRDQTQPAGPDNPPYFDVNRAKNLAVQWSSDPRPALVPDLDHFRIQLIDSEGAQVWESPKIRIGTSPRATRSKNLAVSEFRDRIEDGLHFLRIRAYTASGDLVSDEDVEQNSNILRDPANPLGKRIFESDDIWFWKDRDTPPPVDPQRNITVPSFLSASLHANLMAVDRGDDIRRSPPQIQRERTKWVATRGNGAEANYHIVYDAQARYTISLSGVLRAVESRTLAEPEALGRWRLVANTRLEVDTSSLAPRTRRSSSYVPDTFLSARAAVFRAIRGDHERIVATADLLAIGSEILNYAQAYADWLDHVQANFDTAVIRSEEGRRRTDALFLDLDTLELVIQANGGEPDRAYLLGPTHPLRLLWHLQHARMAQAWLDEALGRVNPNKVLSEPIRQFMRAGPILVNQPPQIRIAHEGGTNGTQRFYIEQGGLTPFWNLYAREDTSDTRTLRARVMQVLGLNRKSAATNEAGPSPEDLQRKLLRYLGQHPYVRTLKINSFNPGDAGLIVDTILLLEKELGPQRKPDEMLRYELRLFSRSRPDAAGAALGELLNPAQQVSAEADTFSVAAANHLFPKLRFSRNTIDEFLQAPEQFEAHLTIMYDLFPVSAEMAPALAGRSSYVYGLIQEHITHFADETFAWQRQIVPGSSRDIGRDDQQVSALISHLLLRTGQLQAAVSTGRARDDLLPTIKLTLGAQDKNLIYQVHNVSDWVLIIDRHLGLEYFDSNSDERAIYMLDFTPEFAAVDAERLLLTTRAVDEVTRLIRPHLVTRGLGDNPEADLFTLQLIRSLSGRLALKLLAAPNNVGETLGLAMARLLLDQYQLLDDTILIPLDAHVQLFEAGDGIDGESTFQRGDLLLVSCDIPSRTLTFHITEVKWRNDLGDIAAYHSLRQLIEQQVQQSIRSLRSHFDPQLTQPDRIDRQLKIRELAGLLLFYLDRSRRYGLISARAAENVRAFIETLDQGYQLQCRGVGLIFDFGTSGIQTDEEHANLSFHRVGRDYMQQLMANGLQRQAELKAITQLPPATIEESAVKVEQQRVITDTTSMRRDSTFQRIRTAFGAKATDVPPQDQNERVEVDRLESPSSFTPPTDTSTSGENRAIPVGDGTEAVASSSPDEVGHAKEAQPSEPEQTDVTTNDTGTTPALDSPGIDQDADGESSGDSHSESTLQVLGADGDTIPRLTALPPDYDILIGDGGPSRQYGLVGRALGQRVALDLNSTNTISLFGVQGGGKSYTVGSIVEMATSRFTGVNHLPAPLASVIFHYHESQDYAPEFVSMVAPNDKTDELALLAQEYGAQPGRLEDVLILTSADKVAERQAEFPSVAVAPIAFSSRELSVRDWRFLMGVFGDQMYMKQINLIMRQIRGQITLDTLRREIEASDLVENQKRIVRTRLSFAAQFIDDERQLADLLRPGRLIVVDLRDELIEKEEALGLFVVMLNIFAGAKRGEGFNKMIVFDEAHKYMDNRDLTSYIVDVIRQMRHQGVSVVIASQDPPSLPNEIIELSSILIMHRFNSPQWLKHVQRSITALSDLTAAEMANLRPGEAYVWANRTNQPLFTSKAVKMRFRPRITRHGGATKTAVD